MRSRANLPILLGYAIGSLAVLGYLATQMGGEFFLQPGYRVEAVFQTSAQLVAGDDVTISGLRVGKVESVEPAGDGARVVMLIHQRYAPLYRDARAMVKSKNLLGETYVELNRGTPASGPLPAGGRIERDHTLTPVEVARLLDVLDPNTRERLQLLINSLGASVAGRGDDLNQSAADLRVVAESLDTVARALEDQDADLDLLIPSLRKVLDTLAAWRTQFRALISDWDRLMQELASRERDLQGLFVEEDRVMAIFDQALTPNAQELHGALAEAPSLIANADTYLRNGGVAFNTLAQNRDPIASLFYELASALSGTDSQGRYMWRIYPVLTSSGVSAPCPAGELFGCTTQAPGNDREGGH